jgi:hypothetical protein
MQALTAPHLALSASQAPLTMTGAPSPTHGSRRPQSAQNRRGSLCGDMSLRRFDGLALTSQALSCTGQSTHVGLPEVRDVRSQTDPDGPASAYDDITRVCMNLSNLAQDDLK